MLATAGVEMSSYIFVGSFGATLTDSYTAVPRLLNMLGQIRFYGLTGDLTARQHGKRLRKFIVSELKKSNVKCIIAHSMGTVALLLAADSREFREQLSGIPIILTHAPLSVYSLLLFLPGPLRNTLAWLLSRHAVASALNRLISELPPVMVPCNRIIGGGSPTGGECNVLQGLLFALELSKRANRHGVADWYSELEVYGIAGKDDRAVVMNNELWMHMRYTVKPLEVLNGGGHRPFRQEKYGLKWANMITRLASS